MSRCFRSCKGGSAFADQQHSGTLNQGKSASFHSSFAQPPLAKRYPRSWLCRRSQHILLHPIIQCRLWCVYVFDITTCWRVAATLWRTGRTFRRTSCWRIEPITPSCTFPLGRQHPSHSSITARIASVAVLHWKVENTPRLADAPITSAAYTFALAASYRPTLSHVRSVMNSKRLCCRRLWSASHTLPCNRCHLTASSTKCPFLSSTV